MDDGVDFRRAISLILGEFMLEFGALERDLNLALDFIAENDSSVGDKATARLKMQERIQIYRDRLSDWPGADDDFRSDLNGVIDQINISREIRNRFAHGRWGILRETVALVTIGADGHREQRFTLAEFRGELDKLISTKASFLAFRRNWKHLGI